MDIFEENDYKTILRQAIAQGAEEMRGYQSRCAEAMGCHRTFLSQVLNSHVHLTVDQAAELCRFWNLGALESEYFLALVQRARSGSRALNAQLDRRLAEIRRHWSSLSERLQAVPHSNGEALGLYFARWYTSAIHLLLTIPAFRKPGSIAAHLGLSLELVEQQLAMLHSLGFAARVDGEWQPLELGMHLPGASPFSAVNHANWRHRALASLDREPKSETSFHYTALHTMSRDDALRLRRRLLDVVTEFRREVEASPEEEAFCFCMDFFVAR